MSLEVQVKNLATAIGADILKVTMQINGRAADLSALKTTAKTNLVAALNELKDALTDIQTQPGGVTINDTTASTTTTFSGTAITTKINAAIAALVNSSPAALDTLRELATALGDDPNFAATVNTALSNRVRFDAAQTLTVAQQKQASQNIGVGDPEANFVTTYTTARDAV